MAQTRCVPGSPGALGLIMRLRRAIVGDLTVVGSVRIGLIGAGVMARIHARCLSRHVEGGELVALADLDREKAGRCAEEFGAASLYRDRHSLLSER